MQSSADKFAVIFIDWVASEANCGPNACKQSAATRARSLTRSFTAQ